MKGQLTIIHVDGRTTTRAYDSVPPLKDLQAAVGGLITGVPHFETYQGKPCVVFANDEGLLEGLPLNYRGTALWRAFFPNDPATRRELGLVGDVVILTGDDEFLAEI